ncbi:MAG: beta-galactosidase [Capsulimonadaceae bacterium]|nr:beta-galactosidase [Capsulimonadaceae bacterium]
MSDFGRFLYGGDYNPDQWLDRPDVLEEDIRLMKLASVNCVSLGIFAWAALEPEEGRYDFGWLDETVERLHKGGISIDLATPSGAKPAWMAFKYPQIRRVNAVGQRDPQCTRHNHCWTSPIYREKVRQINTELSRRYGKHPAVVLWHLSNEYGGECYCDLCFDAFRQWLRARYGTIDALNKAYWSAFWSHTYADWDQIKFIDGTVNGLKLDWQRFTSEQAVSFIKHEVEAIRAGGSDRPVVTNMMGFYPVLNYWDQAPVLDYVSQDSYPGWHKDTPDPAVGLDVSFTFNMFRSLKAGKPWILMESTTSTVNWADVSRPKRPGMLRLQGLQAVAHGSTSVMYFQWRKGRGGAEKFHGAVVDHTGDEHNRVFRESAQLGAELVKLGEIADARTKADVAIVYDWNVRWAHENSRGLRNVAKDYLGTCQSFYKPLWKRGVATDVIDSLQDFSKYRVVIAPMLYLLRPGVSERLHAFVEGGGTLIGTYESGQVDDHDLVYMGGFPGPLRDLFGIWVEETDVPVDSTPQSVAATAGNALGLSNSYKARHYCDILHLEGAESLATFTDDFYAGGPAVTVNKFGKGQAYYIASRNDERFQDDLVGSVIKQLGIAGVLGDALPDGVTATSREKDGRTFVFVMNFNNAPVDVPLPRPFNKFDGGRVQKSLALPPYGCEVLVELA